MLAPAQWLRSDQCDAVRAVGSVDLKPAETFPNAFLLIPARVIYHRQQF